jgi:hypothetical protein
MSDRRIPPKQFKHAPLHALCDPKIFILFKNSPVTHSPVTQASRQPSGELLQQHSTGRTVVSTTALNTKDHASAGHVSF